MTSLTVTVGRCSLSGKRDTNEDFVGFVLPNEPDLSNKGVVLVIADGVSGGGGQQASTAVGGGLLIDYYAAPETWDATFAIDHLIDAANRWLVGTRKSRPDLEGMATTLTVVILRGPSYCIGHVGDSRAYQLRDSELQQLTTDHVWDQPELRHVLTRAVGLDNHVAVDYQEGAVSVGDIFLLATDGVWSALSKRRLRDLLLLIPEPQTAADTICAEALASGSTDNASALVVRIDALPQAGAEDFLMAARDLPLLPKLAAGDTVDGLRVDDLIAESRSTLVYQVRDVRDDDAAYVLKTLRAGSDNVQARTAITREEWLVQSICTGPFPRYAARPDKGRTHLYYLMSWHDGASLQRRLDEHHHFSCEEVVGIGSRVARGLGILHRRGILHRDIKPANLHAGADGELRILDFGIAKARSNPGELESSTAGTPSYIAPELYGGAPPSARSDIFAAGVTLYHLLTRKYPFGEIEPFQRPRFKDPVRPTRYRNDIPAWLESALLRAVARDPKLRFETAEEMLLALEHGPNDSLGTPRPTPLAARDPLGFWRGVAAIAIVLNLLLLYLLLLH